MTEQGTHTEPLPTEDARELAGEAVVRVVGDGGVHDDQAEADQDDDDGEEGDVERGEPALAGRARDGAIGRRERVDLRQLRHGASFLSVASEACVVCVRAGRRVSPFARPR